jgi:hypothetical protein
MNLKLVFKIGAVWLFMWSMLNLFAPDMANIYGFSLNKEIESIMRGFGIALLSLAVLHWVLQMWGGENLPKFGQVTGIMWVVFILMQLNDLRTGLAPTNVEMVFPVVLNVAVAGLFFLYSKK